MILEMGGSEALSQLEAVRIFEEALNKKIRVDHVPTETLQAQHQSHDPLQKTFGALTLAYSKGDVVKGAATIARQHGVVLRSVAEYASAFSKAAAGIVDDHGHANLFADVHRKVKVLKDQAREENKNDADLRKRKLVQEFDEISDEEPD